MHSEEKIGTHHESQGKINISLERMELPKNNDSQTCLKVFVTYITPAYPLIQPMIRVSRGDI